MQPAASRRLCEQFYGEVCVQSWRTELDAGLPTASSSTDTSELLLVVAHADSILRLLRHAAPQTAPDSADSSAPLQVLHLKGWNVSQQQQGSLSSWWELQPQLSEQPALL